MKNRRYLKFIRALSVLLIVLFMVYLAFEPHWIQGTAYLSLGGLAQQFHVERLSLPDGMSMADLHNGVYAVSGWRGGQAVHLVSLHFKAFPTTSMARVQEVPGWEHFNWASFAAIALVLVAVLVQTRLVKLSRQAARNRRYRQSRQPYFPPD